jgi:hypothetical protein
VTREDRTLTLFSAADCTSLVPRGSVAAPEQELASAHVLHRSWIEVPPDGVTRKPRRMTDVLIPLFLSASASSRSKASDLDLDGALTIGFLTEYRMPAPQSCVPQSIPSSALLTASTTHGYREPCFAGGSIPPRGPGSSAVDNLAPG